MKILRTIRLGCLASLWLFSTWSSAMEIPEIPKVPAFLPTVEQVPATQPMPLDGTWLVPVIGKKIRIDSGRAYAVDGWTHLFVLDIQPGMVVLKDLVPTGPGQYAGEDLPLMGGDLDFTGKRSYTARLKKVKGDWYESCRTRPIEGLEANDGRVLTAEGPTGCVIQNGDEVAGIIVGGALSAGAAYFSVGTSAGVSGAIAVAGASATTLALKSMDTATSVDGVLWVEDNSCR